MAVAPIATDVGEALTARLVTVASASVTVMATEPLCPPNVPVTVTVPAATPVTVPESETVATLTSLGSQTT